MASSNTIVTVSPAPVSPELTTIINNGYYAKNGEPKKKYYLSILTKLSEQAGSKGIPYGIIKELTTRMGELGEGHKLPNLIPMLEGYRSRVGMAPPTFGGSRKRRRSTRRHSQHRSKTTKKRRSK